MIFTVDEFMKLIQIMITVDTYTTARKLLVGILFSAKLHYTDTGYGHVVQHQQRTNLQQFYNLLYNKFTTNGQKICDISTS